MISAFGVEHTISKGVPKGMKRLRLTTHELPGITSIKATRRKKPLGEMQVVNDPGSPDHGTIWGVEVPDKHQRKGLATAMYQHAQRKGIPVKHSELRTNAGDAWAKSVGGDLPKQWHASRHVSKMVIRVTKKPKGKLVKLKVGAVNSTHKIVQAGAGPSPTSVALRSITPLRALVGH